VENIIVKVSCGNFHSLALTESGKAYSWGQGKFGALGLGRSDSLYIPSEVPLSQTLKDISAGGSHSGFISAQDNLFMTGDGSKG
jgi:alpha-tubulin suppressor-like RCC1 family protein